MAIFKILVPEYFKSLYRNQSLLESSIENNKAGNMAFKPIDSKRNEYRRYLERGEIIELLTKVLVRILKEGPEDPTQYLLQKLGNNRL